MSRKRGCKRSSSFASFSFVNKRGQVCWKVPSLNKRGQVTIFIIVGIILLFVFAAVLYVTNTTSKGRFTAEGDPIIKEIPLAFKPIELYTQNCLTQIGKKGLILLGEQGGYVYPESIGKFSSSDPTDSDGLTMDPLIIPYWHYNVNPNEAKEVALTSLRPELEGERDDPFAVNAQLGRYIEEQIDVCLNDYTVFDNQGFTIEPDDVKEATVTVTDQTVNLWLRRDVTAKLGEAEHKIEQFYVKIPLSLKGYYEVASQISAAQQEFTFLENIGLDLVQVYSGTDPDRLPPTTATTFEEINTVFWQVDDVKRKFQAMLLSNIPLVRHANSNNFYRREYPISDLSGLYQRTSDNMILPLENGAGLDINFDYFGWDVYLDINEGEKDLKAEEYKFKSPLPVIPFEFNFQEFYNTYDFSFPVLVSIYDPNAFDGEGYRFSFALEATVVNNRAVKHDLVEPPVQTALANSMVCDDDKRDTELIKSVVIDSYTQEPLDLVNIGFQVPQQDYCTMGTTNGGGELETNYPAVYGGIVDFVKEDYLTNFYPIDTYFYKDQPGFIGYEEAGGQVELHKFKDIKVRVKKKNLGKCLVPLECEYTVGIASINKDIDCQLAEKQCFFNGGNTAFNSGEKVARFKSEGSLSKYSDYYFLNSAQDLTEDESVVFSLERVGDNDPTVISDDYSTFFNINGNRDSEVRLVPGKYKLSATLFSNEAVTIPKDKRCFSYTIVTWDTEECNDIKGTTMEKFVAGKVEWDTEETYLEITPEQLYGSDEITLYILNQDLKSVPDKTTTIGKNCGGLVCVAGECLFEGCVEEDLEISAKVIEDVQLIGEMRRISQEQRDFLEPTYS
jgi:hypothetical protein